MVEKMAKVFIVMKSDEVRLKVKLLLAKYLHESNIEDSKDLFASGLVNSLFAMELILFIEKEFDIIITNEDLDFNNFKTIDAIVGFIESKLNS
jgi:acyl carrier protein